MDNTQQTNAEHRWKGLAMEPLADDAVILKIFCPELLPGATQGPFSPGITQSTITTTNKAGVPEHAQVNTTNYIEAEWRSLSNEAFPPSVGKGEQVWLYQQGNTDKFYWDSAGRDRERRTLERRRTEISATPNENEAKSDDNTYHEEWNSKGGYVTLLKSSKKNGEPYALYMGVDTKAGRFMLTDDKGDSKNNVPNNQFIIDFANDVFQYTNNQKATIRIDGEDIYLTAPRDLIQKAGRQIILDAPLITFNREKAGAIVANAAYVSVNAANDIVLSATRIGLNGLTKISQILIAVGVRAASLVTGSLGSVYSPIQENLDDGSYTASNNTSDQDISGSGDRHVAAWEDVNAAFNDTATAIQKVAAAVPTSVDTSGITSNAASAKIDNLEGQ